MSVTFETLGNRNDFQPTHVFRIHCLIGSKTQSGNRDLETAEKADRGATTEEQERQKRSE